MNILLIGPYWGNAGHGAEVGIYDALVELGHDVDIWDYRVRKFKINDNILTGIDENSPPDLFSSRNYDMVLSPGAGLTDTILRSKVWKSITDCIKVCWNSEPIRLQSYKDRILRNKDEFHAFFTFDESEIELYQQIGIDASWLPQAFNSKWYKPLNLPVSQRFDDFFVFIGSIGGKWSNREHFLNRVRNLYNVNIATIFDADKVNRAYNMHVAVLNIGLYLPELGPPEDLRAEALQQRIFESIGAGKLCITNRISEGTNELFNHGENILFYNKDNLEEVLAYAMVPDNRKRIEKNILKIRNNHSYVARMKQLLGMLEW